jgi:O-antigen ligase
LVLVLGLRFAPFAFWQRWEETRMQGGDVRTRELWPAGLKAFAQRPLMGSGLGTNAQAIAPVRGRAEAGTVVHNPPLAVATELGLPGLALYLGFIVSATARLLRALAARLKLGRSRDTTFAIVLFAGFAGYMTSWFKSGGAEQQKMLWVLLGLMSAYARILEQPTVTAGRDYRRRAYATD